MSGAKLCALCGKPASADYRPFCSRRCADLDLQRWFSGAYAVPVETETDETSRGPGEPLDG